MLENVVSDFLLVNNRLGLFIDLKVNQHSQIAPSPDSDCCLIVQDLKEHGMLFDFFFFVQIEKFLFAD